MKIQVASSMVWDETTGAKALVRVELDNSLSLLARPHGEREKLRKEIERRINKAIEGLEV